VRQLENAVFRAVVLAEGDSIGINEFPQIAGQVSGEAAAPSAFKEPMRAPAMFEVPPPADFAPEVAPSSRFSHDALTLLDAHGDVRPLEEIEAEVIRFAIAHYRGQMSEVARRLQIGRSTLYRKLENLGLAERSHEERKEAAEAH
jgi:DNA-binding NtrC family response regulator